MEPVKVVIAHANIFLREGLRRVFSAESHILLVGEAGDNVEVANLVERTTPDVLLLDFDIPKRKAVPALLELEQKHVPVKVLIFSLVPDREDILDTAKAGARGYIALNCTLPSTLIHAVRMIHKGEIWVDTQLKCAETFVEFARQKSGRDLSERENGVARVLSKRELEILALVAKGLTNPEIGKRLFISLRTVKAHMNHVLNKLNVRNRTLATLLFVKAYPNSLPGEGRKTYSSQPFVPNSLLKRGASSPKLHCYSRSDRFHFT